MNLRFNSIRFKRHLRVNKVVISAAFLVIMCTFSTLAQDFVSVQPNTQKTASSSFSSPAKSVWFNPLVWYNPIDDSLRSVAFREETSDLRNQIQNFAFRFLGRPYRSSGKKPATGFDCSGFTGFIFRNFGMKLKASSVAQATEGRLVSVKEATVGDLAFFGRKGSKGKVWVNHAAIVISKPGQPLAIIHSASNKGIVVTKVSESRYWKNSLLFVRNVL
ncbi:MAG TPA: NlpC/P60 family protein [Catalimonadaceae bacterium]|nr:NlpC/P60 family protein [Catalimonadaceae bacterium]HPI09390.1 NlpC/P60 family protein [Catalimonadaceae bacterium]